MRIGNYQVDWNHLVNQGRTTCSVYKDGKLLNAAIAVLAEGDQYDRRIGRRVSLKRALETSEKPIPKHEREYIWTALVAKGVKLRTNKVKQSKNECICNKQS